WHGHALARTGSAARGDRLDPPARRHQFGSRRPLRPYGLRPGVTLQCGGGGAHSNRSSTLSRTRRDSTTPSCHPTSRREDVVRVATTPIQRSGWVKLRRYDRGRSSDNEIGSVSLQAPLLVIESGPLSVAWGGRSPRQPLRPTNPICRKVMCR